MALRLVPADRLVLALALAAERPREDDFVLFSFLILISAGTEAAEEAFRPRFPARAAAPDPLFRPAVAAAAAEEAADADAAPPPVLLLPFLSPPSAPFRLAALRAELPKADLRLPRVAALPSLGSSVAGSLPASAAAAAAVRPERLVDLVFILEK